MTEIRKAHKKGGSVIIVVTDFCKADTYYTIEKQKDKVVLMEVKT